MIRIITQQSIRSVTRPVLLSLVTSLVLPRLDYGTATLAGIPKYQLDRVQSILNAAARLIWWARKYDHVPPLLQELHWLSVAECIKYIDWLYWCLVAGMTRLQSTWQQTFNGPPTENLDSVSVRHPVSSWSYQGPDFSLSATVLSVPLLLVSGTVYLRQWPLLKHSTALGNILNPFISLFFPFIVTLLRLYSFCNRVETTFT